METKTTVLTAFQAGLLYRDSMAQAVRRLESGTHFQAGRLDRRD